MRIFVIFSLLMGTFCFSQSVMEFTPLSPRGTILDYPVIPQRVNENVCSFITDTDSVEFALDNNVAGSSIGWLNYGDVEAIRFTTEHPCSLYELSFYIGGYGSIEAHVWEDWSGLPNTDGDLVPFMFASAFASAGWVDVDIVAETGGKLYIPPMTDFQVGRIFRGAEPNLFYATNHTGINSHVYDASEDTWYYIGDSEGAYPYMIRARGIYFNIDTVKQFHNVADSAGVTGGRTIAWGDFDGDGFDDIAARGTILHNNGDGTFSDISAGISGYNSWADFDGDGLLDLIGITYPMKLYRNNGDRTFTNIADSLGFVDYDEPKNSGGFGDINGDGWLDLYVTYSEIWHDPPESPEYFSDHLYVNRAGTLFVEVTDSFAPAITDERYSRGVHFCDFDRDGDQDIYISCYRLESNWLLVNDGTGIFSEEAGARGCAGHNISGAYGHTIGSKWCDYDNDGDFDIIAANLAHPRFIDFSDKTYIYQNDGSGNFTDFFPTSGIVYYETHSSLAVGDYDNDGNLDLYISCVYAGYHSWIYKGNGDGTFVQDNYKSGVWTDNGWGCGFSDYDNDGDLDLLVSGNDGLELYRNDNVPFHNNWVKLRLFCDITSNNYFAYGAQARFFLDDGRILSRCIQGNSGTEGCQESRIIHFGLGEVEVAESLVITWPGGENFAIADLPVDKWTYDIYESGIIDSTYGIGEYCVDLPDRNEIRVYPNPFNSECAIVAWGDVEIFDITGKRVASLGKPDFRGMPMKYIWDGKDNQGGKLPTGTYLIKTQTPTGTAISRVVMVK